MDAPSGSGCIDEELGAILDSSVHELVEDGSVTATTYTAGSAILSVPSSSVQLSTEFGSGGGEGTSTSTGDSTGSETLLAEFLVTVEGEVATISEISAPAAQGGCDGSADSEGCSRQESEGSRSGRDISRLPRGELHLFMRNNMAR